MQLMPGTARHVARRLKQRLPRTTDLLEPETNIGLGTAYLHWVLNKLDQHPVLATAAYNAGPRRVRDWLPDTTLAADLWVETVPFSETRGYLRRVLSYTVIYQRRLGQEPTRLRQRMPPVTVPVSRAIGPDESTGNQG